MKRRTRVLLIVSGSLLLLVLAALLLLPLLIDVDSYREPIRARAEAALGRPVRLGPIHLSIFPRLALSAEDLGVSARPDEGGGELLSARRLDVGAALRPLLSGRLEISGITVREPVLTLRRARDGSLILPLPADGSPAPPPSGGGGAAWPDVTLDRLALVGARVLVQPVGGGEPAPLLENLDLALSDVAPGRPLAFTARGGWVGPDGRPRPLGLSGTLAWPGADGVLAVSGGSFELADSRLGLAGRLESAATPPRIDLQVSEGSLAPSDVADLASLAGLELPLRLTGSRPITLSGRLKGPVGGDTMPALSASIGLQDATLEVPDMGRLDKVGAAIELDGSTLQVRNLAAMMDGRPISGEATARMTGSRLDLDPLRLDLFGGRLQGSARLDLTGPAPSLRIGGDLAGIDLGDLMQFAAGSKLITGTLGGRLQATSAGAALEDVVRAAVGEGRVEIDTGHLSGLDVLDSLTQAADLFGEQSLKALSSRLAKDGTDFMRLAGPFQVKDGQLVTPEVALESQDLKLAGRTRVDLLAATLDGAFKLTFSEALSATMRAEGSRAARAFWDSRQGRVVVPLTLTGPLDAPTPGIDWKDAAGTMLEGEIGRELDKRGLGDSVRQLLGRDKAPEPVAPPPAAPAPAPAAESTDPAAAITQTRRSGNMLAPDLKLSGWIAGTVLASATLTVTDAGGQVLLSRNPLPELTAALQGADPAAALRVNWSAEVDGKRLLAARYPLLVRLAVGTGDGRAAEATQSVGR